MYVCPQRGTHVIGSLPPRPVQTCLFEDPLPTLPIRKRAVGLRLKGLLVYCITVALSQEELQHELKFYHYQLKEDFFPSRNRTIKYCVTHLRQREVLLQVLCPKIIVLSYWSCVSTCYRYVQKYLINMVYIYKQLYCITFFYELDLAHKSSAIRYLLQGQFLTKWTVKKLRREIKISSSGLWLLFKVLGNI